MTAHDDAVMSEEAVGAQPVSRLAGIVFARTFAIDELLAQVAGRLEVLGFDLAGVIQTNGADQGCDVRSVRLRGLRGGWEVPILQDRGRHARGCRLDPNAIADVAGRLEPALAQGADMLIINRFGRAEAEGHGLRHFLERAVTADIPVLIAIREDYAAAWAQFHGGIAETLPVDLAAILAWCRAQAGAEVSLALQE